MGDAAAYDTHSRALAHLLNVAVVFVGYRLAPEHPFPAAVEDVKNVMDWLGSTAVGLNIDAHSLVLMGESAGGNLAVNAALHATENQNISVKGLTLIYPVTDMRPYTGGAPRYPSIETYATGMNLDNVEMEWFCSTYLTDMNQATLPENTLFLHSELHRLPTTSIYVAECDPLRDMGLGFATHLMEKGVNVRATCFASMMHSFMCHGTVSPRALRHFFEVIEDLSRLFDQ